MKDLSNFDEKIMLYLLDELPTSEKHEFEALLKSNSDLNSYFQNTKEFFNSIKSARSAEIDKEELNHARLTLFNTLVNESESNREKSNFWYSIKNIWLGNVRLAGAAISILLVGILIGYYFFSPVITERQNPNNINIDDAIKSNPVYVLQDVNLSSVTSDEVSITLDGNKKITFSGNMNDPLIKYILARTLVSSENDGIRLKTLNTIYNQAVQDKFIPDEKIKAALIKTAKYDSNPAVRKNALQVLSQYDYDNQILDTYLFTLSNDKNSGNRIIAINLLAEFTSRNTHIDKNLIEILKASKIKDRNTYVQNKSDIILRGINQ